MGGFKLSDIINSQHVNLNVNNQINSQPSQKFDLVIRDFSPLGLSMWREGFDYHDLSRMGGWMGLFLFEGNKGYVCNVAAYSEYFKNGPGQNEFELCQQFPDAFKDMGASQNVVDSIYNWMLKSKCDYQMEGVMAFYLANNKNDVINILKSCQYIGKIYEVDVNDNIIVTY